MRISGVKFVVFFFFEENEQIYIVVFLHPDFGSMAIIYALKN